MNGEALGVIETVGMAAAIEAADSCVKSANVELIGYELTKGSGLVTIKIQGNVGAVKAAIEAAKASATRVNKVYATLIIPRPAANLESIIESDSTVGINNEKSEVVESNKEALEEDTDQLDSSNRDESDEEFQEKREDLVCDGSTSTNPVEDKELGEEVNKEDVDEEEFNEDKENSYEEEELQDENEDDSQKEEDSLNGQESDDVCNICHDPACPRKKGQPKTLCIHYKTTRR
ncbi:BMC domain-containing protein [Clostridiaceae bacterium UIB06]|uniref:BMC domain-containing protein n=1 Tax=Clostridium thailandense TaxID=2794346 RepID=A0A949TKZ5_9CLOT|nr:BMC domain-containing protein [Clostridium thailandense]MBV7274794.1 BMC domain-containing protein [Clostridium thailandense]MCH5137255.1 BMC domain-containing protein [Clostridiaceae bacterium UIB06]